MLNTLASASVNAEVSGSASATLVTKLQSEVYTVRDRHARSGARVFLAVVCQVKL